MFIRGESFREVNKDLRVALIGENGFLGSQLLREFLNMNVDVQIISTKDLRRQDWELDNLLRQKTDLFISMAWLSNNVSNYQNSNGNFEILEKHKKIVDYCTEREIRLLLPGTCLEKQISASNPYIDSKRQLLEYLTKNYERSKYLWIRYFYIFSLSAARPRIISEALKAKRNNEVFQIINPLGEHDYLEVRDSISQTMYAILQNRSGIWDIGSGKLRANAKLIEKIPGLQFNALSNEPSSSSANYHEIATKLVSRDSFYTRFTDEFFDSI